MWKSPKLLISAMVFIGLSSILFVPTAAHALNIPFGGLIVKVMPCLIPAGGLWMTITPAGSSPPMQIWSPATMTYREGPPTHPGQWVLGLDSGPGVCVISIKPYIALPGMMMLMVGTSK